MVNPERPNPSISPEAYPRWFSLEQIESYVFLVDNNLPAAEKKLFTDTVQTGLFQKWEPYIPYPGRTRNLFVDNPTQPKYLAKVRKHTNPHFYRERLLKRVGDLGKQSTRAKQSLANEFVLTPQIAAVLNSPEAQNVSRQAGYQSIDYIAPCFGFINSLSGVKTAIYRWQPGITCLSEHPLSSSQTQDALLFRKTISKLVGNLSSLFHTNGIFPGDFDTHNFIESADQRGIHLHIIDSEMFFKE